MTKAKSENAGTLASAKGASQGKCWPKCNGYAHDPRCNNYPEPVYPAEAAILIKAKWRYINTNTAWCWQEPGTRARYRLADALALENVRARTPRSGGSHLSKRQK